MARHGKLLGHAPTYIAQGAVRGQRFGQFVAGGVKECTVQGERVDCIFDADAADQKPVTCLVGGVQLVVAGAAVAEVAQLMTDNQGRAITYVAAGANRLAGLCGPGNSAGAAGDVIEAHHWPGGVNF
jgi:hypothetical protein